MQAQIGDVLTVKGRHQGEEDRHGEIIQVIGADGAPPYLVSWQDGHESLLFVRRGPGRNMTSEGAPDGSARTVLTHRQQERSIGHGTSV
jgi:hypothetical protein